MKNRLQRLLPPSPVLLSVPACPQALTNLPPPPPPCLLIAPSVRMVFSYTFWNLTHLSGPR